jgi:hypothetical protein
VSTATSLVVWNQHLAAALLVPGRREEPLYFYVDEDVLTEASGLPRETALADFLAASRPFTFTGRPFGYAVRQARRWRGEGCHGAPPHLWALALTVLAVTSDPVGDTDSVYRVQNHLLDRAVDTTRPPGYAEDVPQLWTIFNEWLQVEGRDFGLPTARSHDRWVHQGWARSQALFRFRDRRLIEAFFAATGFPPGSRPTPALLLDAFEQWLRYRGAAGEHLLARLGGGVERAVAEDVLAEEAARWTGHPRSRSGTAPVSGLLTLDDWTDTLAAVVRDERLVGIEVDPGDGNRLVVDEATGFIPLSASATARELIEDGLSLEVAPGLVVRVDAARAYAFVDEPSLGLLLQVIGPVTALDCRLLVRLADVADVEAVLSSAGSPFERRPASIDGWAWIRVLGRLPASATLAQLGLGGLASAPRPGSRLRGGLRVAPNTYLCGGEPTLELRAPGLVVVGGTEHVARELEFRLSDLGLDPGTHTITIPDGQIVRFTSVSGVRSRAEGGAFGWPLASAGAGHRVSGPCRPNSSGLSGARVIDGRESPNPPMLRAGAGLEYLALDESGALMQFWPSPARWVAEAAVDPLQVDALQTVRSSMPARPRVLLSWSKRSGRIGSTEIPPDVELLPGSMRRLQRPDLVAEIFGRPWQWYGTEAPRLQAEMRARAMTWARNRKATGPEGLTLVPPKQRCDIRDGSFPNPYDDILSWLSEKESGGAGLDAFRDTWAWACDACGLTEMNYQWRRALAILGRLGHVEVDQARRRVAVAPATLLRLPVSNGLHVLCGARPITLIERIDDPDDPDERVAEASSALIVHRRTPFRDDQPAGPTAVLVEWDLACRGAVVEGLRLVGVEVETSSLLSLLPTLDEALSAATHFTASPARQVQVRVWSPYQRPEWRDRTTDVQPGLYRYCLGWRDVFGFRAGLNEPLIEIDRYLGIWADERARGRDPRLLHHSTSSRLLVDTDMPLPPLLARALTLRTGLPPWLVRDVRADERPSPTNYLVYDNVNAEIAQQAARTIGQSHVTTTAALEVP